MSKNDSMKRRDARMGGRGDWLRLRWGSKSIIWDKKRGRIEMKMEEKKRKVKKRKEKRARLRLTWIPIQFPFWAVLNKLVANWGTMGQNQVILRHQKFTYPRVSGASEQANGRASGPVLQSVFLAVLDQSAVHNKLVANWGWWKVERRKRSGWWQVRRGQRKTEGER